VSRYVSFPEIPDSERAIGQRLRAARREFRISQSRLAPLIDMTRDQLNNVELGRVALRLRNAWEACRELDLNPVWLQTGEDEQFGFADLSFGAEGLPREALFSEFPLGYSDDCEGYSAIRRQLLLSKTARKTFSADRILGRWLEKIPIGKMPEFSAAIEEAARLFLQRHREDVKAQLTSANAAPIVPAVTWPQLRSKLKRLTNTRGRKSALAKKASVSRQVLNAWLSDRAKPNVVSTLFLLSWVAAEEAKQHQKKRAGSADTLPALKTHRKLPYDRKQTTDPRKER
jgi:DNA-binding XRE family transcriptional regulator